MPSMQETYLYASRKRRASCSCPSPRASLLRCSFAAYLSRAVCPTMGTYPWIIVWMDVYEYVVVPLRPTCGLYRMDTGRIDGW